MPTNATVLFQFGGFPDGYCPTSYQTLGNDFAAALTGYLPGSYITVITGDTEPAAIDRDKPWIRSDGRWYQYSAPGLGTWVARNNLPPGAVMMYAAASEADIWAFDGGDGTNPTAAPPTASTGAMWEMVSQLAGKIPIGPGTLPVSTTVLTSGSTGGVDQFTLSQTQLPDVDFQVQVRDGDPLLSSNVIGYGGGGGVNTTTYAGAGFSGSNTVAASGGNGDPINNMPPYFAIYFIRRTARIWYTI